MAPVPEAVRSAIERRAGERCEYCRAPQRVFNGPLHVEHIVPRSRGGADDLANLALSCSACNLAKGAAVEGLDPETGAATPLFHPRIHAWAEHFAVAEDRATILGTTPIGRATVRGKQMNAPRQLAARPLWRALGLFP
ncbi:MAG TPA: HNH endonuclease [Thermomicrobiales bacterium]|nr:HNH endonuclease [Thermomicrobiales bacterium]